MLDLRRKLILEKDLTIDRDFFKREYSKYADYISSCVAKLVYMYSHNFIFNSAGVPEQDYVANFTMRGHEHRVSTINYININKDSDYIPFNLALHSSFHLLPVSKYMGWHMYDTALRLWMERRTLDSYFVSVGRKSFDRIGDLFLYSYGLFFFDSSEEKELMFNGDLIRPIKEHTLLAGLFIHRDDIDDFISYLQDKDEVDLSKLVFMYDPARFKTKGTLRANFNKHVLQQIANQNIPIRVEKDFSFLVPEYSKPYTTLQEAVENPKQDFQEFSNFILNDAK